MLLQLDFSSDLPIYLQIRNQIVLGIASGALVPGERLPTIRTLADEAGVNMMTVSKAYALLREEGYIRADRRGGERYDKHNRPALAGRQDTPLSHARSGRRRRAADDRGA